jgi:hypothetical protein
MPRLRLIVKVLASILAFALLIRIMSQPPPPPPSPPPEPPRHLTEQELTDKMMEDSKKELWPWKSYETYVKQEMTRS